MPNLTDYETVAVFRSTIQVKDGHKNAGKPTFIGVVHALVQPVSEQVTLETGRTITHSGYDLVSREPWPENVTIQTGDLLTVRGQTLIVDREPESWCRGPREIGWKAHVERSSAV